LAALCTLGCPHPLWCELAAAQDGRAHDLLLEVPYYLLTVLLTAYCLLLTAYCLLLEHALVLKASPS